MNDKKLLETSKFLSYVLRHEPHTIGLQLDAEGWADIDSLIVGAAKEGQMLDDEMILQIVLNSDKRRFSLSGDGRRIRAAQGHSALNVRIQLMEKEPPKLLYHGTATRFLDSILEHGLVAGTRHHVHLSQEILTATTVAQRYGKPVVLKIEALRMHQQGFTFFHTDNDVWLTETVPVDFISKESQQSDNS